MTHGFLNGEDILVITAGYWDAAKRIRHKMPMQWARRGSRILWIEQSPFLNTDRSVEVVRKSILGDIREVEPRLYVAAMPPALPFMYKSGVRGELLKALHRPFYVRRLRRYLKALDFHPKVVVLFQEAARRDIFDLFPNAIRIYYHHDVYGYGHATSGQHHALSACCEKADMVWCVAKEHKEQLEKYNPKSYFIPHAVDEHWYAANKDHPPVAYENIPLPRLVYTGVFQEKIDLPLLVGVAKARPEWQQVIAGPVLPKHLDTTQIRALKSLANVHFLGEREVDEIPGFLEGATVLMLPYLPTENMKSAGLSLKFFEYLISGKPILVSPYTKMQVPDSLYYLADGPEEWAACLDRLRDGDSDSKRRTRIEAAMENTYAARLVTQTALVESFGME